MTHAAGVQVPRGTIELGARVVQGKSTVDAYHDRSAFVPLLQEASGILARQHRDGCTTCQSTGAVMVDGKWAKLSFLRDWCVKFDLNAIHNDMSFEPLDVSVLKKKLLYKFVIIFHCRH